MFHEYFVTRYIGYVCSGYAPWTWVAIMRPLWWKALMRTFPLENALSYKYIWLIPKHIRIPSAPPKFILSKMCKYILSIISDFGTDSDYLRDVEVSLRAISVSVYTTNDLIQSSNKTVNCLCTDIHFGVGVECTNKFISWPGLFPCSDGHHHTKKPLLWSKWGKCFLAGR